MVDFSSTAPLEARLLLLLQRIDQQAARIESLEAQLQSVLPQSSHVQALQALQARVHALEVSVGGVQRSITLPTRDTTTSDGTSPSIGLFSAAVAARVSSLERAAAETLATRDGVTHALSGLAESISTRMACFPDEYASRHVVSELLRSHTSLCDSVNGTQALLAQKVDKSDVAHMAATARELQGFADFRDSTLAQMRHVETRVGEATACADRALEGVARVTSIASSLAAAHAGKADSGEVRSLSQRVEALALDASQRATAADVSSLSAAVSALTARSAALESALMDARAHISAAAAAAHEHVETRAGELLAHMEDSVASVRTAVEAAMRELDTRAYTSSLEASDERTAAVEAAVAALTGQVGVALRFVAWFTERGEAYEMNAAALERHMNGLASSARSQARVQPMPSFRELLAAHAGPVRAADRRASTALRETLAAAGEVPAGAATEAAMPGGSNTSR